MRIAIFLPNWIGDVVMATPAVRALRDVYPDARIIGVLKSYVRGVIEGAPWFDDLIESDSAVLPVARRLRAALVPTDRNKPIRDALGRLPFRVLSDEGARQILELPLDESVKVPDVVRVEEDTLSRV